MDTWTRRAATSIVVALALVAGCGSKDEERDPNGLPPGMLEAMAAAAAQQAGNQGAAGSPPSVALEATEAGFRCAAGSGERPECEISWDYGGELYLSGPVGARFVVGDTQVTLTGDHERSSRERSSFIRRGPLRGHSRQPAGTVVPPQREALLADLTGLCSAGSEDVARSLPVEVHLPGRPTPVTGAHEITWLKLRGQLNAHLNAALADDVELPEATGEAVYFRGGCRRGEITSLADIPLLREVRDEHATPQLRQLRQRRGLPEHRRARHARRGADDPGREDRPPDRAHRLARAHPRLSGAGARAHRRSPVGLRLRAYRRDRPLVRSPARLRRRDDRGSARALSSRLAPPRYESRRCLRLGRPRRTRATTAGSTVATAQPSPSPCSASTVPQGSQIRACP